jgi:hypothetical protein
VDATFETAEHTPETRSFGRTRPLWKRDGGHGSQQTASGVLVEDPSQVVGESRCGKGWNERPGWKLAEGAHELPSSRPRTLPLIGETTRWSLPRNACAGRSVAAKVVTSCRQCCLEEGGVRGAPDQEGIAWDIPGPQSKATGTSKPGCGALETLRARHFILKDERTQRSSSVPWMIDSPTDAKSESPIEIYTRDRSKRTMSPYQCLRESSPPEWRVSAINHHECCSLYFSRNLPESISSSFVPAGS